MADIFFISDPAILLSGKLEFLGANNIIFWGQQLFTLLCMSQNDSSKEWCWLIFFLGANSKLGDLVV